IADEVVDRLLTGDVAVSGRIARTEAGLTADAFRIANDQVQLNANGSYSNALADFLFSVDLADLALLSDDASGKLSVVGTAKGADSVIDLKLDATVPSGTLADRSLRNAALGFAGRYNVDRLDGKLSGAADLDGHRASLGGDVSVDATGQALRNLDFSVAGTSIRGGVTRTGDTGLLNGNLTAASPDIAVAGSRALLEGRGADNAEFILAGAEGQQGATVRADVKGLVINNDIRVGAADISAAIGDLFGVPMVDGTANARNVAAAGVEITSLTAKANQSGDTTAFDAQAALTLGTNIDVAGSLTPIANGYRLGLDRAQLQQGQLSARLAQPTVLQVAGSKIAIDNVRFDVGSGSITASGSAGDVLDIALDITALPLNIANTIMPELGLAGTVNGRATVSGTGADPRVVFEARAD